MFGLIFWQAATEQATQTAAAAEEATAEEATEGAEAAEQVVEAELAGPAEKKPSPRGICLIVNNKNFSVSLRRDGADVDEKLLKGLFQDLDFTVEVKHDLTRDEIKGTAEEFAAKDHSQFDAFVFFILSHGGDHDTILGCDEGAVGVRELMRMFTATKCPSLEAKPKLFFIQACRGAVTHFQELSVHRRLTSFWGQVFSGPPGMAYSSLR